jgi:hypothetical protein
MSHDAGEGTREGRDEARARLIGPQFNHIYPSNAGKSNSRYLFIGRGSWGGSKTTFCRPIHSKVPIRSKRKAPWLVRRSDNKGLSSSARRFVTYYLQRQMLEYCSHTMYLRCTM